MASAVVSWNRLSKPSFVNLKSNCRSCLEPLRNDQIPAVKELYPNNNFIFNQDSVPSHRAKIVWNLLWEEVKYRFVAYMECPPSFPDCNRLDFYFWNEVKEKVYIDHYAKPFESEKELKDRISSVWDQYATNVELLPKAIKVFTTFKSHCNKRKKIDQCRV